MRPAGNVGGLLKKHRLKQGEAQAFLLDVANQLWSALDTPTSLGLALLAKAGDYKSLLKHKVRASDYLDSESFYLDYQAVSFLSKCPLSFFSLKDRVSAAKDKFFESEEACRLTNKRFRSRYDGVYSYAPVEAVLHIAQRKISYWLGTHPDPMDWISACRFGPGADSLTKGNATGAYHKLEALSSTEEFADGALCLALDHPAWARWLAFGNDIPDEGYVSTLKVDCVPGNRIVFVPKTALIERSIAVEPRMNVYAQLGLGKLIRRCLKRANNDIDSQNPNQDLTFDASIHGHLATIDLAAASDTISVELVRDLLPPGWFTALDWTRSRTGTLDNRTITYEKFSSMGNGYTFELETLIFLSLVRSVCEYLGLVNCYTRVFGDDIICPVEAVALLEEVLTYCGFKINTDKSFTSGVFRESCGKDFFDGTNVRPHFCKEVPTDVQALYRLANDVRLIARRLGRNLHCDLRLRAVWRRIVCRIPTPLRFLHPSAGLVTRLWGSEIESGDGGLIMNFDEASVSPYVRKARNGWEGYFFGTCLSRAAHTRVTDNPSLVYAYALFGAGKGEHHDDPSNGLITVRGSSGVRFSRRAYTLRWVNLGPWS